MLRQGEGSVEIREGKAPPSLKIRDQKTPKTRHFACSGSVPLFLVTEPGGYRLKRARIARQGELCRTCDAEKKQAADWCVPSPGVRCHTLAAA